MSGVGGFSGVGIGAEGGLMADYHRMSAPDKRRLARARMREDPLRCPRCGLGVQPDDLLKHVEERCEGRGGVPQQARWVTWSEALAMGVPRKTMHRWVRAGRVRSYGQPRKRKYLMRDISIQIAKRKIVSVTSDT